MRRLGEILEEVVKSYDDDAHCSFCGKQVNPLCSKGLCSRPDHCVETPPYGRQRSSREPERVELTIVKEGTRRAARQVIRGRGIKQWNGEGSEMPFGYWRWLDRSAGRLELRA